VGESDILFRQLIEMWSFMEISSIRAQIGPAQVVGDDEYDIWTGGFRGGLNIGRENSWNGNQTW